MKFFKTLSLIGLIGGYASATFTAIDCGEGKVPSAQNRMCIEPKYIEGCLSYVSQNQCAECKDDYELNESRCDFIGEAGSHSTIPGCLATNSEGQCVNCANGFRRIKGNCQYGIKNCRTYDASGKCSDCKEDFSLVLGQCRHNLLLGCRLETQDHECKECFEPFKMNGNHCQIENCKSFNDFGCTACQCGFYLTPSRDCKEAQQGCLRYQRGICINCLPHYKLKGGICEIDGCMEYSGNSCEKCDDKYEKNGNGGCNFKNCYDWLDGKCLVCQNGFRKEGEECVELSEDALKCA